MKGAVVATIVLVRHVRRRCCENERFCEVLDDERRMQTDPFWAHLLGEKTRQE